MAAMNPGFRQDIQGLRALAVLLVILDHARIGPFHGGFIGVDVFFVISGFLITGLLVSEAERTGRVSLLGFYARRARRILPAATLVIVATVAVGAYYLSAVEASGAIKDALWATFFAANFKLARDGTDYFQNDTPPSPLQHFWSLAVEEQFYVVWPLLVLLLCLYAAWRARRSAGQRSLGPRVRDLGVSPLVVIVGFSFAYSVSYSTTDPVVGVLLAVHPRVGARHRRPGRVPEHPADPAQAGGAGRAVVGRPGRGRSRRSGLRRHHGLPRATPPPSRWSAPPPCWPVGSVPAAWGPQRLLSLLPMRALGDWSYSLYLWHWPALIIAAEVLDGLVRLARRLAVIAARRAALGARPTTSWRTRSGPRRSSGCGGCAACCSTRRSSS